MIVKWTDEISAAQLEMIWDRYPEAQGSDFDKHYQGEVMGSTKSFWGYTYLTIMCTDGKVREVEISKVKKV